jgi:hypothetical protein
MNLSELLNQIDDFKDAASLVGDDDPRLFFLIDRDDTQQVPCTNVYLAFDHTEQRTRLIFW